MAGKFQVLSKNDNNGSEFRDKIRKHKLRIFYRIAIGLIVAIAFLAIIKISLDNKVYTEYRVKEVIANVESADTTTLNYNGNILSYNTDGASCLSVEGQKMWNQTFEMQNPMVKINNDYVAIGDYNGHTIYLMNSSGKKGEIDTRMPIRDFCVSQTGLVIAILDDSNITGIYVFDQTGEILVYFKTTMEESGYPLSVSVSPNGEMVGVTYLFVDSGVMTSSVAFYNFGAVGQNYTDKFVSGYDYSDAVVPYVEFMNEETAFAVADNRLMIYQGKHTPAATSETILSEELISVFHNESYIGLVYNNSTGETKYKMDVYDAQGTKINTITFDFEYSMITFHEDTILLYNGSHCSIYNSKGMKKFSEDFTENILALIPTKRGTEYTLVTDNKIEIIELR